jgi:hypothetical protein
MTEHAEGTGAGLQDFLEWAGRTGEMNPTTAEAWAVACRRILDVSGDPEKVDVRTLDVDALLARFENLYRTKYSSGSMTTYKSRFRSAVAAYVAWLANEPWKPNQRVVKKKGENAAGSDVTDTSKQASTVKKATEPERVNPPAHDALPRLVSYNVPLRPDLMVDITLPVDLTKADAARIAAFVNSLAFSAEHHPPTSTGGDAD